MDDPGRQGNGFLFASAGLGAHSLHDAETFFEGVLEDVRLAAPGSSGTDAHDAHQSVVHEKRRLDPCHIARIPAFHTSGQSKQRRPRLLDL